MISYLNSLDLIIVGIQNGVLGTGIMQTIPIERISVVRVPIVSNCVIPVFGLEGAPLQLALYWPLVICSPSNIRSRNWRKVRKQFQMIPTFISIIDLDGYLKSDVATGSHAL